MRERLFSSTTTARAPRDNVSDRISHPLPNTTSRIELINSTLPTISHISSIMGRCGNNSVRNDSLWRFTYSSKRRAQLLCMESSPSPASSKGMPPGPGSGPSSTTSKRQVYPAMSVPKRRRKDRVVMYLKYTCSGQTSYFMLQCADCERPYCSKRCEGA